MNARFEKQLEFLVEVDKMKTVFRQTLLVDKSRQENDAEHSWHFALMAMILYEYADQTKINLARVLKMALVHDLVEIYAGDTFAYDEKGNADKEDRENLAADKLFALLPQDQGEEIMELWQEFDLMETADSAYAAAIDRLQPFISNFKTDGHTWKRGNVTKAQVFKRMDIIKTGAPELWEFVEYVVDDAIKNGYIQSN